VAGWLLDKGPVNADLLSTDFRPIERINGRLCVLERLVLNEGITLYVAGSPVEVQVHVLNLSIVCKLVPQVFLQSLLIDVGHKQDPPLHRSLGSTSSLDLRVDIHRLILLHVCSRRLRAKASSFSLLHLLLQLLDAFVSISFKLFIFLVVNFNLRHSVARISLFRSWSKILVK